MQESQYAIIRLQDESKLGTVSCMKSAASMCRLRRAMLRIMVKMFDNFKLWWLHLSDW